MDENCYTKYLNFTLTDTNLSKNSDSSLKSDQTIQTTIIIVVFYIFLSFFMFCCLLYQKCFLHSSYSQISNENKNKDVYYYNKPKQVMNEIIYV